MPYSYKLFIDRTTGALVRDFWSAQNVAPAPLVQGDKLRCEVHLLEPDHDTERPFRYVDITGETVMVAIGVKGRRPLEGTVEISYGGGSATVDVGVSASALETALNSITPVGTGGGVDVVGPDGGPYRVKWRTAGARTGFTLAEDVCYPRCAPYGITETTGDGSTREVNLFFFEAAAAAGATLGTALPSPALAVTELNAASPYQASLVFDPVPLGGYYVITVGLNGPPDEDTIPLDYEASAADILAALEAVYSPNLEGQVSVEGDWPEFIVTVQGNTVTDLTADVSGLVVPTGKYGTLDLDTHELAAALAESTTKEATLEVQLANGAGDAATQRRTVLHVPVTVIDDVLPTPGGSGMESSDEALGLAP